MTTANKITLFRVLLIPVFLVLVYTGQNAWALAVYVLACLSDALDGFIARRCRQESDLGRFADPLADKMLVVSALCCFVSAGQIPGWALAVVLCRDFAVDGLRIMAIEKGRVIAAAFSGKLKTAATMVAICLMLLLGEHEFINTLATAVILATTVYSGIEYFCVNRDIFKGE